jgi:tRNA dimethylallyltransferase
MTERPTFLAIAGSTCSGKTELSLGMAEHLGGEIVSMDSRQVYRGMDVGTDKVSDSDRARIPHFGLDLLEPNETYSAGQFARDARAWIGEIGDRGRLPILAGGTGFFLRAVQEPVFREPSLDPLRRPALKSFLAEQGGPALARWVRVLDPERADLAIAGGPQRMARTLEVALLTGRPLSWWHGNAPAEAPAIPGFVVLLELPRPLLYERINQRVARMVERGLVEEVEALLRRGYTREDPGMTGTGYREIAAYLSGECTLDDALELVRRATRRYARRQLTWFRNQLRDPLTLDAALPVADLVEAVANAWQSVQSGGETSSPPEKRNP